MVSAAEQNRLQFAQAFNSILGDKIGKPIRPYSDAELANSVSPEATLAAQKMLAKGPKIPKTKAPVTNTSTAASNVASTLKKSKQITDPAALLQTDVSASNIPGGHAPAKKHEDKGVWGFLKHAYKAVDEAVTNNPVTDAIQNNAVTKWAAEKGLEGASYLSRPYFAVSGALNQATDAQDQKGEQPWRLGDEFAKGFWQGLSGKETRGFGNLTDRGPLIGGDNKLTRDLVAHHLLTQAQVDDIRQRALNKTGVEQWSHRLAGGAGDVLIDPLTYFHGGSVKAAVEGLTAKGLREGTVDVGKQAIKKEFAKTAEQVITDNADSTLKDILTSDRTSKIVKGVTDEAGNKIPGHVEYKPVIQHIVDNVGKKIDDIVYEMKGGQVIGGTVRDAHATVAHATAEAVRDEIIKKVAPFRKRFVQAVNDGRKFTATEFVAMRAKHPLIAKWLDAVEEATNEFTGRGEAAVGEELATRADQIFAKKFSPLADSIYGQMKQALDEKILRIPTVSMMGHTTYLPRVGEALDKVGRKVLPKVENLNKMMNYASHFPGYSTHIAQNLRSLNVKRYEDFRIGLEKVLQGTTKEDRRLIHTAIQEGRTLTGHLAEPQQYIKNAYADMYAEEVAKKSRSLTATPPAENYVFNKMTGGINNLKNFDRDWRQSKKLAVRENGTIDGFTSKEAAAQGMKLERDAGQALLARKAKSLNSMSRIDFQKDLIAHYGIKSSIPAADAFKRDLKLMDRNRFPELYKGLKPTENIYLDKDIHQVYENYKNLAKYQPGAQANDLVRTFDKLTRIFKTSNTIYWPGFHIRNLVSDIFMGALDGVKSTDYEKIMNGMIGRERKTLLVGGERMPFNKVYNSYFDKAATGFFDTEINQKVTRDELATTRYMDHLGNPKNIPMKLRKLSTQREDLGRLVHYYHALDEEYGHQLSKGLSKERAWKDAEVAAQSRVNKFKFDYNALTPSEQKFRRYGMPFYTYMRKAAPVLVQSLFMNPKYYSYINKLQNSLAPNEDFKGARLPAWMNDLAFSQLSGGDEPTGFTDALFPTRTLKDSLNTLTPGGFLSKINPIAQVPIEAAMHQDLFTGKPIPHDNVTQEAVAILKNKWRGTSVYRSIESDTKPTMEKWFGFFGIPIVQVTKARQAGQLNNLQHQLDTRVQDLNKKLADRGLKLRISHNKIVVYIPKADSSTGKEQIQGTYDRFDQIPTN